MDNFRISVKSFIINKNNELLLIKRRSNDVHKPGIWEIPGGRLEVGEDPFIGLKRETKEETGLDIEILNPLVVKHFNRDDGQKITIIVFYCRPLTTSISLSEEHTDYVWTPVKEAHKKIAPEFLPVLDNYIGYFLGR